jgi:hypothetical protein
MNNINEEEKQSILASLKRKIIIKKDKQSREVKIINIRGSCIYGKGPFYSGFTSKDVHWGLLVGDSLLVHFIYELDDNLKPIGIKLRQEHFNNWGSDKAAVTDIGTTSFDIYSDKDLSELGKELVLQFGGFRGIYRNSQAVADILVQFICNESINENVELNVDENSLISLPMTTKDGLLIVHKTYIERYENGIYQKFKRKLEEFLGRKAPITEFHLAEGEKTPDDIVDTEIIKTIKDIGLFLHPKKKRALQ